MYIVHDSRSSYIHANWRALVPHRSSGTQRGRERENTVNANVRRQVAAKTIIRMKIKRNSFGYSRRCAAATILFFSHSAFQNSSSWKMNFYESIDLLFPSNSAIWYVSCAQNDFKKGNSKTIFATGSNGIAWMSSSSSTVISVNATAFARYAHSRRGGVDSYTTTPQSVFICVCPQTFGRIFFANFVFATKVKNITQ